MLLRKKQKLKRAASTKRDLFKPGASITPGGGKSALALMAAARKTSDTADADLQSLFHPTRSFSSTPAQAPLAPDRNAPKAPHPAPAGAGSIPKSQVEGDGGEQKAASPATPAAPAAAPAQPAAPAASAASLAVEAGAVRVVAKADPSALHVQQVVRSVEHTITPHYQRLFSIYFRAILPRRHGWFRQQTRKKTHHPRRSRSGSKRSRHAQL